MPVHSVQLDHLVLLNLEVQDTGPFIPQFDSARSQQLFSLRTK